MLDYGWGNPSTMMLTVEEQSEAGQGAESATNQQVFDPTQHHSFAQDQSHPFLSSQNGSFSTVDGGGHQNATGYNNVNQTTPYLATSNHLSFHSSLYVDPRAYQGESAYAASGGAFFSLDGSGAGSGSSGGYYMVPKTEDVVHSRPLDFTSSNNRIGLNLGGRTYFSAADDDFVSRLYQRSRHVDHAGGVVGSVSSPRCQAEGCGADLTNAKHYHRRHKVCEFHSKASTVIAAGLTQRFCQQCSRFHLLSEFDNGKRSCRKRLADHNRRRRKSHQNAVQDSRKSRPENNPLNNSSNTTPRSPQDSGARSSTSVTVPVSPLRISLDCFGQRQYQTTPSSSSPSSSSFFFSTG